MFIIQAQYGLGKHQATISAADMVIFQQAGFWQSVISANCALGLLKISIGFNLLRLSSSKWYSWALWATIGRCRKPVPACLLVGLSEFSRSGQASSAATPSWAP